MHDEELRRYLSAENEEQTFTSVRLLWREVGPDIEHLIRRLLPEAGSADDRRLLRREIVVSLWANRQQLVGADNLRKRALELALLEAAWYLKYTQMLPAESVR